jgi:polyketide cyclase/dehydrase/lipid transport protein
VKKPSLAIRIHLTVAATLAALAAVVVLWPAGQRVERSATLAAPPAAVLAELSDLQRWEVWSPWPPRDPAVQRTFGGPQLGVGASCYWSRGRTDRGRLTVVTAGLEVVEVELEEEQPLPSSSDIQFKVEPTAAGTQVTWAVTREEGFVARVLTILTRRNAAIGRDLEQGLSRLKDAAEAEAKATARGAERSIRILAAPEVVLAQITDLHSWSAWSPWERHDPGMAPSTRTTMYGGPASGLGSSRYWSGGADGARGRMTITRVEPGSVEIEREVVEPWPWSIDLVFELAADGTATRVTWATIGDDPTRGGDMGKDLELGLARLKALVEAEASR